MVLIIDKTGRYLKRADMDDVKDSNLNDINVLPQRKVMLKKSVLTAKQAAFITTYLDTGNATIAVEQHYNCKHSRAYASQLLRQPHIKAAIARLQMRIEDKGLVTFEDKVKVLKDHMINGDRDVSIRAVSELNKMQGHIAPTKNINLNLDLTVETYEQLDIDIKEY